MKKLDKYSVILFIISIGLSMWAIYGVVNEKNDIADFETTYLTIIGAVVGYILMELVARINLKRKEKEKYIFISYSLNDKAIATKIINDLKSNNITVVNENDVVKPGDKWNETISSYIINSNKIIFVISKNTLNSDFLKSEVEVAKSNNINILPILMDDIELPSFLNDYKPADFRKNYKSSMQELLKTI